MSLSTSSSFQISEIGLIQQAQHFFSSENFVGGFEILRSCYDESDVSDDIIFSILKGEIGFNINDNEIQFDEKFIKEDKEQEEYSQLISEVLENYDFLIDINNVKYQVDSSFEFDLSLIANTNDWIRDLKENEGKLISKYDFKYFKEIMDLMQELGAYHFDDAEHILINKGVFYTFKRYDLPLISEISNVFKNPIEAVLKYQKTQDYYE
jgi:hypothetical protein